MHTLASLPKRLARLVRAGGRLHRSERGQDTLEFALLLPFVLFLLFVVIDFGVALGESHAINHAVREAARLGAVGGSEANIRTRAIDQSQSVLTGAAASCPLAAGDTACIEVTWADGPDGNSVAGETGDGVIVRARYRHRYLNPFLAWLPANEVVLGACADSRLEVEPATAVDRGWDCSS